MNKITSIAIVGVGGQGIILASNVIARLALDAGYDVKKSEIHGMSQRGGSVISQVRFGEKVYSPTIGDGDADILMAFEKVETLRYINLLKRDGMIIINNQEISSSTILAGQEEYPWGITEKLQKLTEKVLVVNGVDEAKKLGNIRTVNVILMGALSKNLPFEPSLWEEAIKNSVPPKTIELNLKAFRRGREI